MNLFYYIFLVIQLFIGINLIFPALLYLLWKISPKKRLRNIQRKFNDIDHAIIVTAYKYVDTLPSVINSLVKLNYDNYIIYVVADNCDVSPISELLKHDRVILLQPMEILESNTKSHNFAIENFVRPHNFLTIIDSDNIIESEFLNQINLDIQNGYDSIQGLRAAKNLDNTFSSLDAARDIYYHFYDGKLLFEVGSSATLAGSGMTFKSDLYKDFLSQNTVTGAGFDKVLQSWIINNGGTIAFNEFAIVFDEKTSRPDQLVKQRSLWINTWFKYSKLGVKIVTHGILNLNRNKFLFGLVLLRPPLFIFLFLSVVCFLINVFFGLVSESLIWAGSFLIFVLFFCISLWSTNTDKRIYKSLTRIPVFVFYQFLALLKSKKANEISIATEHFDRNDSTVDGK